MDFALHNILCFFLAASRYILYHRKHCYYKTFKSWAIDMKMLFIKSLTVFCLFKNDKVGRIATIHMPINAHMQSLHLALNRSGCQYWKAKEVVGPQRKHGSEHWGQPLQWLHGHPITPSPSGSVRFKVYAHVFLDLLALASNMPLACHLHWWVLYDYICLVGQELNQKKFDHFEGRNGFQYAMI